ncbi:MAG: hypothetical protein EXR93_05340 [Gemmatimonadetes bacterium]|nr:hypothetical protein [Gemmatimonadota bacterium]
MTRLARAACLGALALLGASGLEAQAAGVDQQLRSNQNQLEEIRHERDDLQDQLSRLRGRVHSITSELTNLDRQKSITGRMVNELDRQIGSMRGQMDTLTLELILAQDALVEKRAVLERRLTDIYKRGPLWTYQALLIADSFGDLLSRYKYLYLVSRQDKALVGEVQELRDRIGQRRQQLVNVRAELARRRDDRGKELTQFQRLEREREQNLRRAQASEREALARAEELSKDERKLNDVIAGLERERARRVAATPKAAAPIAEGAIRTTDLGTLDWPIDGTIIYDFGRSQLPNKTFIRREGVGIAAPVGTPVKAIEAGTVQLAGNLGTYGLSIAIAHGGNFYTVYLYLSHIDVKLGARVAKGAQIALSGGANSDEGPHVEFQIRQGTITLDPINWLKNRR